MIRSFCERGLRSFGAITVRFEGMIHKMTSSSDLRKISSLYIVIGCVEYSKRFENIIIRTMSFSVQIHARYSLYLLCLRKTA